MIRTALTLGISAQDAQNYSFLANGTHLGLLSSAPQNTHIQTSHRPNQLIVAFRAGDPSAGSSFSRQRQLITAWQDFFQLMAHHPGSELNNLMQKYHLQPDWLICLDETRLQAWLYADAGFYLLRGQELRRLRPTVPREVGQTTAGSDNRSAGWMDGRQYYALNIRATDHFFLLPPGLLSFFGPGEVASMLLGLRQLPAKMGELFSTARLRGFDEDCTWLGLQVLRQEEDQLPDPDRAHPWLERLFTFLNRSHQDDDHESGSDSVSLDGNDLSASHSTAKPSARSARYRLPFLIGSSLLALILILAVSRFLLWPPDAPEETTLTTMSQPALTPTVKPTQAPTQAPTTTAALPRLTVSARQLNLREAPDRNSKLLATLKNGDVIIKLAEQDGEWIKVQTADGLIGFVYASYVTPAS